MAGTPECASRKGEGASEPFVGFAWRWGVICEKMFASLLLSFFPIEHFRWWQGRASLGRYGVFTVPAGISFIVRVGFPKIEGGGRLYTALELRFRVNCTMQVRRRGDVGLLVERVACECLLNLGFLVCL